MVLQSVDRIGFPVLALSYYYSGERGKRVLSL